MTPWLASMVTQLYPLRWRQRYGEEFEALLEMGPGDLRTLLDSVGAAVHEHVFPTQGGRMERDPNSFGAVMRRPSAYLPVAMSLFCLVMVLGGIGVDLTHGGQIVRDKDEGSMAHIFQILMTVQMPIVLFFAVKWLRRAPRQAMGILALQAGAWLAACAPIYFFHL